jgi:hypothetical protein
MEFYFILFFGFGLRTMWIGALKTVSGELEKYKLDLVGIS